MYDDYRARIVARALHNRGLVHVTRRGQSWQATLTEDGTHYLERGDYPPTPERPASVERPAKPAAEPPPARPKTEPQPRKTPRVAPTDAMMNALTAAAGHRIEIEYDQFHRYRQLALSAV